MRSVTTAALVRPVWVADGLRVQGPDEDPFTLSVAALESLGNLRAPSEERALGRLHLVGPFPPEAEWGFGEALGVPHVEVRHHPSGTAGFWGALAAAAHDAGERGREAVVAADLAGSTAPGAGARFHRWGAGATAILLGPDPGLAVLRHGYRAFPPARRPRPDTLVQGWLELAGLADGEGDPEILLWSEEDPQSLLEAWERAAPSVTVTVAGGEMPGLRGPPTVRSAIALWELATRFRPGGRGGIAELGRGGSGFAGFRLDAPIRWLGGWADAGEGRTVSADSFLPLRSSNADVVSEGAYVPRERYLESLPSRWRLAADRCERCRSLTFPIRGFCRACGEVERLPREHLPRSGGTVEAVTTVHPGAQPTEFDPQVEILGAYDVAIVRLSEEARAIFQVTDVPAGRLRVGDRVRTVLRRLYPMEGEWRYGLKAVPIAPGLGALAPSTDAPGPALTDRRPRELRASAKGALARTTRSSSRTPRGRRAIPRRSASRVRSVRRRG